MRKGLFAIVLVAAAFAGGAAINGPGLRWARTTFLKQWIDDEESDSDGDKSVEAAPEITETDDAPPPVESPKAKPKKKVRRVSAPRAAAAKSISEPMAPEPSEINTSEPAESKAAASTEATTPEPGNESNEAKSTSTPPSAPAPLDSLPPLESLAASPSAGDESKAAKTSLEASPPPKEPQQPWADAPGSAPAAAVPPRTYDRRGDRDPAAAPTATSSPAASGPTPSPSLGAASASAGGDWTAIRRQMRALGIIRFGLEGEPDGRVRFHCAIPLAGQRAVTQQFEAEGDDEFQAARTALRRVALWRATENADP